MLRVKSGMMAALSALALVIVALPGQAGMIAADALPLPNRFATADCVLVGKVTSFEEKMPLVIPAPGAAPVAYKIAVITVGDALKAPKDAKTIRLGFVPTPPGVAISPPPFQPTVDLEGCFFLTKNAVGDFYIAPLQLNVLGKSNPNYEKDIALLKKCAKIMENPNAALKGKNAEDRFLAAAMLVAQYRTHRGPGAKQEPIDADQSKLILEALAAADWTPAKDFTQLSPLMVLHRLPLTDKDGWMPPPQQKDPKSYAIYAQQWCMDHAATYRIQKFVPAEKAP